MQTSHVPLTIPAVIALMALAAAGALAAGSPTRPQPELFSAGHAYERFMGRWSADLAPHLVRFAGVRDGEHILDVGSGTGALSAAVVASTVRGRVTGIDPSAPYVAFAESRRLGDRARFEVGDGQRLRFENASFDRTLSLLVINFIPDREKALAEMIRVTRPGGIVAAAVWDYGGEMEMLRAFWDEATALRPETRQMDERHMPLCRSGELASLWKRHGLEGVVEEALTIETRFRSFEDYWLPFLDGQGPAGAYTAALSPDDREQLRIRLRQRLVGSRADGPIVLRARAWAVRGAVPAQGIPTHPRTAGDILRVLH